MAALPYMYSAWLSDPEKIAIYRSLQKVHDAPAGWTRFQAIRDFYSVLKPRIDRLPGNKWAFQPDAWADEWTVGTNLFTPIEYLFFQEIIYHRIVLYPQYPACGFFLDFANPKRMVAVECDGREFHKDAERDRKRDAILAASGWTIYRISGKECHQDWEPDLSEEAEERRAEFRREGVPPWESGEYDPAQSLCMMLGHDWRIHQGLETYD